MVMTTINRTVTSFAAAILGAEYVLRIVPPGTHEWVKFISPLELKEWLAKDGLVTFAETGFFYNPLTHTWSAIGDTSVNYGIAARKPLE